MKLRHKLRIFGMLDIENGKMTIGSRQDYAGVERTLFVHFEDDGQNRLGRHLEHSHSHRLIQPNKTEVSITVILCGK